MTGFEHILIIIPLSLFLSHTHTLDFQHANIQQTQTHTEKTTTVYSLIPGSCPLHHTQSAWLVSPGWQDTLKGRSPPSETAGLCSPVRERGDTETGWGAICVFVCACITPHAHLYCNTHVHKKSRKPRGEKEGWVNEPTAGLSLSSSSRRFSPLLSPLLLPLSWAQKEEKIELSLVGLPEALA